MKGNINNDNLIIYVAFVECKCTYGIKYPSMAKASQIRILSNISLLSLNLWVGSIK